MKGLPEFCDIRIRWKDVKNVEVKTNSRGLRTLHINGRQVKRSPKRFQNFDGGARICYLGIDFIVKIDCPLNYWYGGLNPALCQGDHEYQVWMSLNKTERKYFAEVIGYQKNDYIVFKRYDIHPDDTGVFENKNIEILKKLIEKYDLCDFGLHYEHNCCEINRKLLIYDYGFSEDDAAVYNYDTQSYLKFTQKKRRY